MQRRTLLCLGLGAAAVLSLAGGALALLRPGVRDGRLTPTGRAVFSAVARGVLGGELSPVVGAVDAHLDRIDAIIFGLPMPLRGELSDLLALLSAAPGRLAVAGLRDDWATATVRDIQQALDSMRHSPIALRAQAYQALRELTLAAHYANPALWNRLGYPGPLAIG